MDKEHPTTSWIPNLYSKLPDYVEKAIQREVASYNLPSEKARIIADKVYATIAASYQFDPSFTNSFSGASPSDREKIIREFLREYIKKEIDLEAENIKREVHKQITDNYKGSYFQTLDPRGKDYKKYRDNVVGLFFADAPVANDEIDKSNYKSEIDTIARDFNDGKITQAVANNRTYQIETSISNHLYDSKFNVDTLDFHDQRDSLIRSRIDAAIADGVIKVTSSKDRAEIHDAISSGDTAKFTKYVTRKNRAQAPNLMRDISAVHTKISVDSSGKTITTGDGFKNQFTLGMTSSGKKLDGSPYKYIKGVQSTHSQANIADLAVIAAINPAAKTSKGTTVTQLLEKNKLANDILNVSNAVRHAGNLNAQALSKFNVIKTNIENSINSNLIEFSSAEEKTNFLNALRNNDVRVLENFVKPGLLGSSTFSKFYKDVNDENIDLGGATNSAGLTTRGLNFQNSENAFKRNLLNQYIYAAQLAYDPGYAFSEIKQRIKDKFKFANFKNFDVKAAAKSQLFKVVTSITINGKKASKEELEKILGFYKDPQTQIRNFFTNSFKSFLKKNGIDISVKSFWESQIYKRFKASLKLKFEKNIRYLEQMLKLGLRKFSGPVGNSVKKLLNRLGGSSVLIKRAFSGIGSFFSWLVGAKGKGATFFDDIKKIILTSCLLFVGLYVIAILGVIQIILGALSSNSSTPYMPGTYSDLTFSTYQSVNPEVIARGGSITTSGNVCISTQTNAMFTPTKFGWNNLKISDFEGTDNSNNCKIMCNARKIMGGLMPGVDGNLNCNYNFPDMYKTTIVKGQEVVANSRQFWCTNLVMESLKDDDPSIVSIDNRAVIGLDSYMKSKPTSYEMSDLAIPNSVTDTTNLNLYNNVCVDKANFQAGNPIIFRINTCNDTRESGGYKTLLNGKVEVIQNGHVELVLKLTDTKLITVSSNNVLKKLSYEISTAGCAPDQIKVIGTSAGYVGDQKFPMYLCRMYQYKNTSGTYTCPSKCDIPANNYGEAR